MITIFKATAATVADHIAHLMNLSVNTGRFPALLKHASIIPVFKKGDPCNITNYRPISILSVFSKVFERIVYSRMMSFLARFRIVSDSQHGFLAS